MTRPFPIDRGFALISVLVALSILLALAAPFLLAMGRGDLAARHEVELARVESASLSARDFLLAQVGREDLTPLSDGLEEFPDRVEFPSGFQALGENGRVQFGGEAWDLQRKIDLNSMTPLLYSNLLGLTARLAEDHEGEFEEIVVDGNADRFPESGYLLLNREVIRYGSREGDRFRELTRGLFVEEGFQPAVFEGADGEPSKTAKDTLILDFRTVLATAFPFWVEKTRYQPYAAIDDLARIGSLQRGSFDPIELEDLSEQVVVGAAADHGTTWGRPERVFTIIEDALERPVGLRVRSAADIGAGCIVRIRDVDGTNVEYALVASTSVPMGDRGTVRLPSNWYINLLRPLLLEHEPTLTVVERLVPTPVNANTASVEVLAAIMQSLRVRPRTMVAGHRESRAEKPYIRRAEALERAAMIATLRDPNGGFEGEVPEDVEFGPFRGWEDFEHRVFKPWFDASTSTDQRRLLMLLYELFMSGRPGACDMGTVPIAFHSSPLTFYRAAANRLHPLRTGESARLERQGIANARPGHTAFWNVATQESFEEIARLDRRTPFWMTLPVNTSALDPRDRGTDPSVRAFAHTVAHAFPDAGLGQARFPSTDPDDEKGVKPAPSNTPLRYAGDYYQHEGFSTSLHPEGRHLGQEGVYEIDNSGPRSQANQGASPPATHARIRFPLTENEGLTRGISYQFWFRLDDTQEQALFELSVPSEGYPDRNRISLQLRDQALILELIDDAGIDPDPSVVDTAVQRSTGRWEIPIADFDLQPNRWYHANFSAVGNRPGQLELTLDGVPRAQPHMRTVLTTEIPPFQFPQNPNVANPTLQQQQVQAQLHPPIRVETTDGFPPRGVLRIGNELFEYTSTDATTFYTDEADSFGGRLARQDITEFVDSNGLPTNGFLAADRRVQVLGGQNTSFPVPIAPDHRSGATVELYGYSLPAYPNRFLEVGATQLTESLGAFAIARVANHSIATGGMAQIQLTGVGGGGPPPDPIDLGYGIDENWPSGAGDYLLLTNPTSEALPANPADPAILAAFPESGGYIALVRISRTANPNFNNPGVVGTGVAIGGVEIMRYTSRSGNQIQGVQRDINFQIDGHTWESTSWFDIANPRRKFVTAWTYPVTPPTLDERPQWYTYAVPISIGVGGAVPSASDIAEWVQLYPQNNEIDTEWVRYDTVLENKYLVRAEQGALHAVLVALTDQPGGTVDVTESGAVFGYANTSPYPVPVDPHPNRIGYFDPMEITYPAIHLARMNLGFRGDPQTGTSSHAHNAGAQVLPCHRFELDWSGYGALAPRAGRNDRIGLVQGSARVTGQVPTVEWHVVNWVMREFASDPNNIRTLTGNQNPATQRKNIGAFPFQLVALKDSVGAAYYGAADESRVVLDDSRLLDRAVKFPSGELPAADVQSAVVGQSGHQELAPMRGIVDEVALVARRVTPVFLDTSFDATANEFYVRGGFTPTPIGPLFGASPRQAVAGLDLPREGGLLWVDGEILAYQLFDPTSNRFDVATNGRGLLGTTPTAHDSGTLVYFVDQIPTEVLSAGVNNTGYELLVNRLGALPADGGTVLLGTELLHYAWTEGVGTLAMPAWTDPAGDGRPEGLLRGRYGTTPVAGATGEAVIWFPFRYWDRFHERADDPAMAYAQYTSDPGLSWFDRFGWIEEGNSELVDLQCYVRVDHRGRFDADPEETPGLFRFRKGEHQGGLNRIGMLGSAIELRFCVEYKPGAFDGQTFLAQDWKYAPILREFVLVSESEPRILSERITAR
ncbi:MAG: hypothetical protein KDB80_05700 [Planctomycetes bacterium]|nr:hypothetical protein [Planctomycetota bacterium]